MKQKDRPWPSSRPVQGPVKMKQFANEATTPQYVMDFNYWLYNISVASQTKLWFNTVEPINIAYNGSRVTGLAPVGP